MHLDARVTNCKRDYSAVVTHLFYGLLQVPQDCAQKGQPQKAGQNWTVL